MLIGIGGAIGSVLRYELSKIPPVRCVPAGTLIVNVTGSFAFALVVFSHAPQDILYLAGTGGLGGFTTFSTFSYETVRMLENHDYYTMGVNILTNVGGSIAGVLLGWLLLGG
ncbi:MAG TPA: CrcB family protein [Methanoregula sp.]|nr:CrcB family protein [Methanoregula sp.]